MKVTQMYTNIQYSFTFDRRNNITFETVKTTEDINNLIDLFGYSYESNVARNFVYSTPTYIKEFIRKKAHVVEPDRKWIVRYPDFTVDAKELVTLYLTDELGIVFYGQP